MSILKHISGGQKFRVEETLNTAFSSKPYEVNILYALLPSLEIKALNLLFRLPSLLIILVIVKWTEVMIFSTLASGTL